MEVTEIKDPNKFWCYGCSCINDNIKYYKIKFKPDKTAIFKREFTISLCENCICDLIDHLVEIIPDIGNWYDD